VNSIQTKTLLGEVVDSIAAQEKDLLKVRAGQGIVNFSPQNMPKLAI
jgi:hypothetical protein